MRFSAIGMLRGLILGASTLALLACGGGGGGGSSGGLPGGPTAPNEYKITIRADRAALPINTDEWRFPLGYLPSASSSYATALYVQASRERTGDPIPGGESVFACNVLPGIESGALYYFDGDDDHRATVTVSINGEDVDIEYEAAFRSIVLGSNAGGASFHFISSDKAGTVTIRCAATDPISGEQASKDFQITVGSTPSGLPSQALLTTTDPNVLFQQGLNGPTQLVVQVDVRDEAGQRVPNPPAGTANLMASIVTGTPQCAAGSTANLRSGSATAKSVTSSTINGLALFTIVSGTAPGTVCVEFYTDRSDNNVSNGITNLVYNAVGVPVVVAVATDPLAVSTTSPLPDAFFGTPYAQFLTATGGVPPYTWALRSGSSLPAALSLSTDGVVSGTPTQIGDNYDFIAEVTDSLGAVASRSFRVSIKDALGFSLRVVTTSLPEGVIGSSYAAVVTAANGTPPYTWTASPNPFGTINVNANGTLSSVGPLPAGTFSSNFTVTDSVGATASKVLEVEVK